MKKTIALLLACLSLLLLFTACGEKEKPKLSELSDEDMMAYLKENGIVSPDDIYGEQFQDAAEVLRKRIKEIEDDPKGANIFAASQMSNGVIWFPDVNNLDLVEIVNEYYGLDTFGEPLEK